MKEKDREGAKARMGAYCSQVSQTPGENLKLGDGPIIASVMRPETLEIAMKAPTRTIYLLIGTPLTLPGILKSIQQAGKLCIVNIDFLEGLTRDRSAVEFLAANGAAGIVSTRVDALKAARALGLQTIQRAFAIDHAAISMVEKSLVSFQPDAVEILPALAAPRIGQHLRTFYPSLTIVGGGLIENVREIESILAQGVNAITTSNPQLWVI